MTKSKWLFKVLVFVLILPMFYPLISVAQEKKEAKNDYQIGKTADGKVILSSVKKIKNSRAVGNVQGKTIQVTIGGVVYEGARITIDGEPAFCIDRDLRAPWEADTPYNNGDPFDNKGVKAIMSYGAFSTHIPNPTDEEVLLTEIALHNWLKNQLTPQEAISNSHPFVSSLIERAKNGDAYDRKINFSKVGVTSDVKDGMQVSEEVTLQGANNQVTLAIPKAVTFVNKSTGVTVTDGKATIQAGEVFYFKAPLTYQSSYTTGEVKPEKGEFVPIMFTPFPVGYQRLVQGKFKDPVDTMRLTVDFRARTGEMKILKLDKTIGKPVPNTEFKVDYDGKSQTVKTNAQGEATLKDILHDTKVKITEIAVPSPYVLDKNNTKEVIIQAGKTASVTFKNEHATGKTTLTKQDATTNSAEPLNPNYPMVGAKYGLFQADGTLLKEFTLDETLTATMDNLALGSYYWQETVAPVGYTVDKTKHVAKLTYQDQHTSVVDKKVESQDKAIHMWIDGQKLIQNATNEIFKNGVEFTLTNQRTGENHVILTETKDGKKGYFRFDDLMLDDYVLTETGGVEGYKNVDPIEITHSYDKETDSFTFIVRDQRSGNLLHEEQLTQLELSNGVGVDLGTYTLKDKAAPIEDEFVYISSQAHIGDGKTQSFAWGKDTKMYDDVTITHKNIEKGTKRAFEAILVAVYADGTEKEVWHSGKIDYEVTEHATNQRVAATYDYKKDAKNTTYYFKTIGYKKRSEKAYEQDSEHNFDGKEVMQTITPIFKATPKETKTAPQPKKEELPQTGENVKRLMSVVGLVLVAGVASVVYWRNKKTKETTNNE